MLCMVTAAQAAPASPMFNLRATQQDRSVVVVARSTNTAATHCCLTSTSGGCQWPLPCNPQSGLQPALHSTLRWPACCFLLPYI